MLFESEEGKFLAQHIESLIFASETPVSLKDIRSSLEEAIGAPFAVEDVEAAVRRLMERYQGEEFAFEIVEIAEGYQFLTKPAYHHTVGTYLKITTRKRLRALPRRSRRNSPNGCRAGRAGSMSSNLC